MPKLRDRIDAFQALASATGMELMVAAETIRAVVKMGELFSDTDVLLGPAGEITVRELRRILFD